MSYSPDAYPLGKLTDSNEQFKLLEERQDTLGVSWDRLQTWLEKYWIEVSKKLKKDNCQVRKPANLPTLENSTTSRTPTSGARGRLP
jgi:hypothetical protein